jgi:hypothetical protein
MNVKASFIILLLIISSCSSEQPSERLTTSLEEESKKVSELESAIQGHWIQRGENCNQKGEKCNALENEIEWVFENGIVKWGAYTHHYEEEKGVVTIAELHYKVVSNSKDSLVFKQPEGKGFLLLTKRH